MAVFSIIILNQKAILLDKIQLITSKKRVPNLTTYFYDISSNHFSTWRMLMYASTKSMGTKK